MTQQEIDEQIAIQLKLRHEKKQTIPPQYWSGYKQGFATALTKLYSLKAHLRGKIHRQEARFTYYDWSKYPSSKTNKPSYDTFTARGGMLKFTLTLEDQAFYLKDLLDA